MEQLPLTTLPSLLVSSLIFFVIAQSIHRYVSSHGPIPKSPTALKLVDCFYAIFSFLMMAAILAEATNQIPFKDRWPPFAKGEPPEQNKVTFSVVGYVYHLSKTWEYIDVFLLIAVGGRVGTHMAVHHLTVSITQAGYAATSPSQGQPTRAARTERH